MRRVAIPNWERGNAHNLFTVAVDKGSRIIGYIPSLEYMAIGNDRGP